MRRFILGLLAVVFGAFVAQTGSAQSSPMAQRIAAIGGELDLSRAQRQQIRPILVQSMNDARAVLHRHGVVAGERPNLAQLLKARPQLMAIRGTTRAALSDVLTAKQMSKWDRLRRQRPDRPSDDD